MENFLRIQINALCVVILVVISPALERRAAGARIAADARAFRGLVASTAAMLILDTAGWALGGAPGLAGRIAIYAVNCAYYCVHPVPIMLYILYADFQVHRDDARSARLRKPLLAVFAILVALALTTPLTGFEFTVDEANHYVRGWGFPALAAMLFGLMGFAAVIVFAGRRKVSPQVYWTLLAFPLPVLTAAVAQDLVYGFVLVWPTTTIFLVAATVNIQRRRASTDHLTGAANRRSLDEALERLVGGAKAGAKRFGGILLDLNDFKSINDNYGHESGDRALEDAAAILRSAVRQEDTVARYGGDEFVVLLPNASEASLSDVVERIRRKTESQDATAARPYRLSFSVGAALYDPVSDGSAERFLSRLDASMYEDKAARKKNVAP